MGENADSDAAYGILMDLFDGAQPGPVEKGWVPFFVINPRYHDGVRASFKMFPIAFYGQLVSQLSLEKATILDHAFGRSLAVVDTGLVLSVAESLTGGGCRLQTVEFDEDAVKTVVGKNMTDFCAAGRRDGWLMKHKALEDAIDRVCTTVSRRGRSMDVAWHEVLPQKGGRPVCIVKGGSS